MAVQINTNSPYFPYCRVHSAFCDLKDTVYLPRLICDYLIDAPQNGYTPQDNNEFPRCRFWKYLYYDGEKPLENALPTIQEKMGVVFNPDKASSPPTAKGYRLIPQMFISQSQEEAQTRVYVYLGRTVPNNDPSKINISVIFRIFTHYSYETNTHTDEYSRAFAVEQALLEAFNGLNMAGIGTFYFSKSVHPDCGSHAMFDGSTNIGRELTIALEYATTAANTQDDIINQPFLSRDGKIRMA